jgi:tetratricopeptide (TPR) repeat protein
MNELERLLRQDQSVRLLQSIEVAAWLIVALLVVVVVVLLLGVARRRRDKRSQEGNWSELVERAYESGQYEKALQTLATSELLFPRSASIKYWQGRCHFQQEAWDKAVEKFEACCRLEPPYRRSVRDYMAFIELNGLVPGVTGYLEEGKSESSDGGATA